MTDLQSVLREELAAPATARGLAPHDVILAAHRRQRRRRVALGGSAGLVVAVAAGSTWLAAPHLIPGTPTTQPAAGDGGQASDRLELGAGRALEVDEIDGQPALCLTEPDAAPSCAVDLAFTREATLAWSDEQIYAWVVRDGTERAALVSPGAPPQEAQIWVAESLGVTVALLDPLPSGPSQELVSWDGEGEVTDVVPGPSRGGT